ncbi:MAG: M42 family metallopeptidase [Erysipelotrichaceae bacterium]
MLNHSLLKQLSDLSSISSREKTISSYLEDIYRTNNIDFSYDNLGSIIGVINNDKRLKKIMIDAHMDEVGFIVKEIDSKGFIYLQTIGSWWSHMLLGQVMVVTTKDNKSYYGVIGSPATHGISAEIKNKTVDINSIYLDMGVSDSQEIEYLGIKIGDMVTPKSDYMIMNNENYICNKAFDDRIGTYILIELFKELSNFDYNTLYLANSVQEEPGLRGARTTTYKIAPDIAFAIDTTLSGDTPYNKNSCQLGKGVVISLLDSNSIANRKLVKYVEGIASINKIPFQYAVFNQGGTDSGNIHKTLEGVISLTLSIPIRYMHTAHSMINVLDVQACIDLLKDIILDLNDEKITEIGG